MVIKIGEKDYPVEGYLTDIQKIATASYQQGKNDMIEEVCNRLDEGLCDLCDCRDFDRKCYKDCQEEKRILMKWLKEQKNE